MLDIHHVEHYKQASLLLPADDVESALLKLLQLEPLQIDELKAQSGLAVEKISAGLTMLELKGLVRQVNGSAYQAVMEDQAEYHS